MNPVVQTNISVEHVVIQQEYKNHYVFVSLLIMMMDLMKNVNSAKVHV